VIGSVIDSSYEVRSKIGEGGFGIVWLCDEVPLGRSVALKMLNRHKAGDRELKRFLAEGRNLASLNHPNVVQIYRFGSWEGNPYIVMEHLRGKNLQDLVRGKTLTVQRALEIAQHVAAGLAAIHATGILHHDLSLSNVLVTESGAVKILDLGLSKDLKTLTSFDSQNVLVGTLAYVAPEQIEGKGSSFQAEVFSFGVMLYEMLTGRNPFWAEHYMTLLYNIVHREPEALESRLANCPPALSALISRCLRKDPAQRPADMAEVERLLAQIIAGTDLHDTMDTGPVPMPSRGRQSSSNPYLSRVMIKNREDFFGREQEIKRIFARLNASPPGSMSVVGDRKIGKSSLLNYVYMRQNRQQLLEEPDKTVMVFLDLQEDKGMSMESFVTKLLGIADYELRGRLEVADCSRDLDGIKDLVQRLDKAGFRLALLLDEFEAVTTNQSFGLEFFSFLRFLANHYNVSYLTSSARDLQILCHTKEIADSPFFNIFSTMRLSVFQPHEAEALVKVPSAAAGRPLAAWSPRILQMAGLFPFFIQMACSHTFEWLEENPGAREPDFEVVRRRFYDEAKLHFRYIWDGLDEHERSAALRVARGRAIPDALGHVLLELGNRHYVETESGGVRLFADTFQEFVQSQAGPEHKGSWFGRLLGREKS
jgi:serine/threonine protein kinase